MLREHVSNSEMEATATFACKVGKKCEFKKPFFSYNKTDVAAPFGGFKQSGFGKDLGKEALNEYLKTKTITFEYNL